MLASIIFGIVFGMPITSLDDKHVQAAETIMAMSNEWKIPGTFWVDYAPFLRYIPAWVPGAKFRQFAAVARVSAERTKNQGFEYVRSGQVRFSYIIGESDASLFL